MGTAAPRHGSDLPRMSTVEGQDPFAVVGWGTRSVAVRSEDGQVAFACGRVKAPTSRSLIALGRAGGRNRAKPRSRHRLRRTQEDLERATVLQLENRPSIELARERLADPE